MKTKEKQYNPILSLNEKEGLSKFGLMSHYCWMTDPTKTAFCMSRYKFVGKMLKNKNQVLEIGCADGFYSEIVDQHVKNLTISDFDPIFINNFKHIKKKNSKIKSIVFDILKKPLKKKFDAIYCIDVLEHVNPKKEKLFFLNVKKMLNKNGVFICGIPSIESQKYASKGSKEGHVNCKSGEDLRKTINRHFNNSFMFSMNDEVVHTGFFPMAHYLWGIGCAKK